MAFNVTPTSGAAPYIFTAEVINKVGVDLGLYTTEFRGVTAVGACPTSLASSTDTPTLAKALFDTGTTTYNVNIPQGSCRYVVYLVRRLSDGEVVSQMSVNIDNLE